MCEHSGLRLDLEDCVLRFDTVTGSLKCVQHEPRPVPRQRVESCIERIGMTARWQG
jgi:hypothetical protein